MRCSILLERLVPALTLFFFCFSDTAQSQYYFNPGGSFQRPDSTASLSVEELSFPVLSIDMRSAGMGLTSISDTLADNALQINPALRAGRTGFHGSFVVYGAIPVRTFDAITFLGNSEGEFISGSTAKDLYDVVNAYSNDPSLLPEVSAAIQRLLEVPRTMVEQLVGDPNNPDQNGANLAANFQFQIGQFGGSVMAYGQSGFVIDMGSVYNEFLNVLLTTNFQDTSDVIEAISRLQGITDFIVDPTTGAVSAEAFPTMYAVSFADIVGTLGYGYRVSDQIDLGVNLKVLNRRFSFDRLSYNDAEDIAQNFLSDLETGTTGFTADVGAMLRFHPQVEIGVSLQNIIPFQSLSSSYEFRRTNTTITHERDANGNFILNSSGDTSLVAIVQNVTVNGPAKLTLPFIATTGAVFHALEDLDFAIEWVDMFAQQEKRYEAYFDRIRLGAEYRFHLLGNVLMIPVRMGLSEGVPTFGFGANFGDILMLDLAYFGSNFRKAPAYGAQLRVRW
ncbi:MAG: conjugal transfer protein TraF [Ignavibacteria bacterium]|nr:conjugal transfer protein TraF [Ignavibacteria bacterium]